MPHVRRYDQQGHVRLIDGCVVRRIEVNSKLKDVVSFHFLAPFVQRRLGLCGRRSL